MSKTLLEMVEELNRQPVSDRARTPLASDEDHTLEAALEAKRNAQGDDEPTSGPNQDHREEFERLLANSARSAKLNK